MCQFSCPLLKLSIWDKYCCLNPSVHLVAHKRLYVIYTTFWVIHQKNIFQIVKMFICSFSFIYMSINVFFCIFFCVLGQQTKICSSSLARENMKTFSFVPLFLSNVKCPHDVHSLIHWADEMLWGKSWEFLC